ncbi:MAG: MopE-related protein [Nanoarchaeota archaeon]
MKRGFSIFVLFVSLILILSFYFGNFYDSNETISSDYSWPASVYLFHDLNLLKSPNMETFSGSSCTILGLSWDRQKARAGDDVKLLVNSKGCDEGTHVLLTISDSDLLSDDTLSSYRLPLVYDVTSAIWTVPSFPDAFSEFMEGKDIELYISATLDTEDVFSTLVYSPSNSLDVNDLNLEDYSIPLLIPLQESDGIGDPITGDLLSPILSVSASDLEEDPQVQLSAVSLGENQVFIKNENVFAVTNHLASVPISFQPCEYFDGDNNIRLRDTTTNNILTTQIQSTGYHQKDSASCTKGSVMFAVAHVKVSLAPGEERIYDIIESTQANSPFVYAPEVDDFVIRGAIRSVSTDIYGRDYVADIPFAGLEWVVNGDVVRIGKYTKMHRIANPSSCNTNQPCLSYLFSVVTYLTFVSNEPIVRTQVLVVNAMNFDELQTPDCSQTPCVYRRLDNNQPEWQNGNLKYGSLRFNIDGFANPFSFYFPDMDIRQPTTISQVDNTHATVWTMPSDGQYTLGCILGNTGGYCPPEFDRENKNYLGEGQSLLVDGIVKFGSYNTPTYTTHNYFAENKIGSGQSLKRWTKVDRLFESMIPDTSKLGDLSRWISPADAQSEYDSIRPSASNQRTHFGNAPIYQTRLTEASESFPRDFRVDMYSNLWVKYLLSCADRCNPKYLYALSFKNKQSTMFVGHLVGYEPWEHPLANPLIDDGTGGIPFSSSAGAERLCYSQNPFRTTYRDTLGFCNVQTPNAHLYDYGDLGIGEGRAPHHEWSAYGRTHWGTSEAEYVYASGDLMLRDVFMSTAKLHANVIHHSPDLTLTKPASGPARGIGRVAVGVEKAAFMTNPLIQSYYSDSLKRWLSRIDERLNKQNPGDRGYNPVTGDPYAVGHLGIDACNDVVFGNGELCGEQVWMEALAAQGLMEIRQNILETGTQYIQLMDTILFHLSRYLFDFGYKDPSQVKNNFVISHPITGQSITVNEGLGYLAYWTAHGPSPGVSVVTTYPRYNYGPETTDHWHIPNALCLLAKFYSPDTTRQNIALKSFEASFGYRGYTLKAESGSHRLKDILPPSLSVISADFLCSLTQLKNIPTPNVVNPPACPDADADGYSTCLGDCNDANPNIHPNVLESSGLCSDSVDNNCNGLRDCEDTGCFLCGDNTACYSSLYCNSNSIAYCGNLVVNNPNAVGLQETCDVNPAPPQLISVRGSGQNSLGDGRCIPPGTLPAHGQACTYAIAATCGDNMVNRQSEECDGTAVGICGPATSCSASCLCNGPVLNSISPNSITNPTQNVVVTASGRGFVATPTVKINNIPQSSVPVSFVNQNSISLTFTPDFLQILGSGTHQLSLVNPNTQETRSLSLTTTMSGGLCTNALMVGSGKPYAKPSDALAVAQDGDTILIFPGTYLDYATITQDNLIIRGVRDASGNRPKITWNGNVPNGKALFVLRSPHIVIDNLEMYGAESSSANGAALRVESPVTQLTVRNSYFHDSQMQILQDEGNLAFTALLEYNEFDHQGSCTNNDLNLCSHLVYINGGASVTVQNNYFHHARRMHHFKSRAAQNFVLYNRFTDEETGQSNYHIDFPQGGDNYVIGNLFHQNINTRNSNIIVVNTEINDPLKPAHTLQNLYVVANTFVDDFAGVMVSSDYNTNIRTLNNFVIRNNIFITSALQQNAFGGNPTFDSNLLSTIGSFTWFRNVLGYDYSLTGGLLNTGSPYGSSVTGYSLTPSYQYVHNAKRETRSASGAPDVGAYEFSGGGGNTCFSSTELCDGIDNNCNSQIDEGIVCTSCSGGPSGPSIVSVQPYNFSIANNTLVVVTGQNFASNSDIRINGLPVSTIRTSLTELRWNYIANSLLAGLNTLTVYNPPTGLSSGPFYLNLTSPPNAPSNFVAIPQSSTVILLTWIDNANNEDYFEMERRPLPSGTFAIMPGASRLNPNSRTYNNTGLSVGASYEYHVRAVNSAGTSAWSNLANATTASNLVLTSLNPNSTVNGASTNVQMIGTGFSTINCGIEINRILANSSLYGINCVSSTRTDFVVPPGLSLGNYSLVEVTLNNLGGVIARSNSLNLTVVSGNVPDGDGDGVPDSIDLCPNTPANVRTTYGINVFNGCPIPNIYPMTASLTTDFSNVPNLFAVENLRMGIAGNSSVTFRAPISMLWVNTTAVPSHHLPIGLGEWAINLSENYVFINSTKRPIFNVSAEVTFFDTGLTNPVLYRDGVICDSSKCHILSFDTISGDVVANVSGFSSYSVSQGSCGDSMCSIAETCSSCSADCGSCGGSSGGGSSGGGSGGGGGGGGSSGGGGRTSSGPVINRVVTQCSDGLDNDGDELIDYPRDRGCLNNEDDVELDSSNLVTDSEDKERLGNSEESLDKNIRLVFWIVLATLLIGISIVLILILKYSRNHKRINALAKMVSANAFDLKHS